MAKIDTVLQRFRLEGRRALVTGAGQGIGFGAARALAEAGAAVTLVARSPEAIEASATAIRQDGGVVEALRLDVTDLDSMSKEIAERDAFDILVNNAGTNRTSSFLDVQIEDFDYVFRLNVRAAFFVAQAVARKLVAERKKGTIINMSSQMGLVGAATRSVYCSTKWAMEGMTRAMAVDLAPHGIRVNTICPTFLHTPLADRFLSDPAIEADVLTRIKLGRVGEVDDLIGAILLLASDASSLMTGSSIVVDGGWTAE